MRVLDVRLTRVLILAFCAALAAACPSEGGPSADATADITSDTPSDGGGDTDGAGDAPDADVPGDIPAGAICPTDMATLTFAVDDTANQTYGDGELIWTGSFSYDASTRELVYATSWLPEEGPYPVLFDDGPVSAGGHEPEGAGAGDHVWSVAVCYRAEETRLVAYGLLNDDLRWIWAGPNGQVEIAAGTTGVVDIPGMTIGAHGDRDFKVFLDTAALHADFATIDGSYDVFVKGTMNSGTPVQLLDDGQLGDETAGDGVVTYQQSVFKGPHDGLLSPGEEAQFVFVFAKGDTDPDDGIEYKVDGDAVPDGVTASGECDAGWEPLDVALALDSKGKSYNTAITMCGSVGPECDDQNPCPGGETCVDGSCEPVAPECDDQNPCPNGETCVDGGCVAEGTKPELFLVLPSSGSTAGGTDVQLQGEGFVDGLSVTFGGEPATVGVVTATTADVTTPAHAAGPVDVVVINPGGQSATFPNGFTYTESANAPTIGGVNPATGPIGGGTTVTVTGTNFQTGATVRFDTATATGVTVAGDGLSLTCVTPAHPLGFAAVTVENPDSQKVTAPDAFEFVAQVPDWAQIDAPAAVSSKAGKPTGVLSAQVYEEGVTPGDGAGFGITAEIGYGPVGEDPQTSDQWTWTAAAYQSEVGNNDLYAATVTAPEGTWWLAFRFKIGSSDSWLVADRDGTDNGFDTAQLVTLTVDPAGAVLVSAADPSSTAVFGGEVVTLTGTGFAAGCEVTVDGAPVTADVADGSTITFTTPPHPGGTVPVEVTCGADSDSTLLTYAASWDGDLSEWPAASEVATTGDPVVWGGENDLDALYVGTDGMHLVIGVAGQAVGDSFGGNAIVGYLDIEAGPGTGVTDTTSFESSGALDDALGGALVFSIPGYDADFAFGSIDGAGVQPNAGGSDEAGWRSLDNQDDLPWLLEGGVVASSSAVEAWIPLQTLFGPSTGSEHEISIIVRIANKDGTVLADVSLPDGFTGVDNAESTSAATYLLVY